MAEIEGGGAEFAAMRRAAREHPIETVGRELREMMPFIETPAAFE
jgi:ketol-acid reductoisomerase